MLRAHFLAHRAAYAALLVLAIVGVLVAPISPSAGSLLQRAAWNAAHAPLFAFAGFTMLWLYGDAGARARSLTIAALCAFALLTEGLQHFTGRSPSWRDLLHDLTGIAMGYAAWTLIRRPRAARFGRWRGAALAFILVSTGAVFTPVAAALMNAIAQQRGFPVLFDPAFSGALNMVRILREDDGTAITIEDGGLAVKLPSAPRAGIEIAWFAPDWRGFRGLVVDLENPTDADLPLRFRVADRESATAYRERFRTRLALPARTRRTFRYELADIEAAPGTRAARLDDMALILIFRGRGAPAEFVVHSIRLE